MTAPREALAELVRLDDQYRPDPAPHEWAKAWEAARAALAAPVVEPPFQQRVEPWLLACFGAQIAGDKMERNHRFLEEALELVQATGCTQSEAHQLVDYVYGRPPGEPEQETGGVMVTLAALCRAHGVDMHAAGETELARVWTKVEQIRAKQAAKPRHSPLPDGREPEAIAQLRHLVDDLTHCPNPDDPTRRYIKPGAGLMFSNMVNAVKPLLAAAPPAVAEDSARINCVACGRPYQPQRLIAPCAAGGSLMTSHACECGSTQFAGTVGPRP